MPGRVRVCGRGEIDVVATRAEVRDERAAFGYLVVDTGPSIFGMQVILPGGVIRGLDLDNETVFVGRPRDEILDAPAFDESRSDHEGYLEELGRSTPRAVTRSDYWPSPSRMT